MKKIYVFLNLGLTSILAIILFALANPTTPARAGYPIQAAETQSCDSSRTVNVSGTALVNVAPDRALIQLGVESNGITPSGVENANAIAIQRVIKALESMGVESKDIVTDRYIVHPLYDNYDSLHIKGYRINNIIAITLRDVNKISAVVVTALETGANQVVQVELYTSELRKYRDQARELAMKAASEKALALANAAGAETGCILNIHENTWSYYNGWWYGSRGDLWTQNVVQNTAPSGSGDMLTEDGPVSLGQISVKAEVSATFGLK